MRYKKNFYYTNIDYTNNMVDGFVGENENFVREFNNLIDIDTQDVKKITSVVEFGCDLGNRIDNINAEIKLGIEFDQVADLYSDKYMKSERIVFQTPEDFLLQPFPYKEKYEYGFCLNLFDIFDGDYDKLVERMLEYCDVLFVFSKDRSQKEMADKLTSPNIDFSQYGGDDEAFIYNILCVEGKNENDN